LTVAPLGRPGATVSVPTTAGSASREAGHAARRAATSPALDRLARVGFIAKGLVYGLVGVLAVQVAFGDPEEADQQGALHAVAQQPLGGVVLWVMVAGLAGYALWRLSQAIWGVRTEPDDTKRTAKRIVALADGLIYGLIGVLALRTVTAGPGSGGSQQTAVAKVLDWPGGVALVAVVGAVVAAVGLGLAIHGLRTDFEENLDKGSMGRGVFTVSRALGLVGHAARGLVIALAGALVISAAIDHEPGKAEGLDAALKNLAGAPYGKPLLLSAAAGLIAYGAYCWIEARYRRLGTRA
jgi:hypothetical protein